MAKIGKSLYVVVMAVGLLGCQQDRPSDPSLVDVAYDLKDPDSAKFREILSTKERICGQINSKNSYGGYVGFKRFIHDKLTKTTNFEPDFPDARSLEELQADCKEADHVMEIRSSCKPLADIRDFLELWDAHCSVAEPSN